MQGAGNIRSVWAEALPATGGQDLGGGYFLNINILIKG